MTLGCGMNRREPGGPTPRSWSGLWTCRSQCSGAHESNGRAGIGVNALDDVIEGGSAVAHRLVVPVVADNHIPSYRRIGLRQGLPRAPLVVAPGIGLGGTCGQAQAGDRHDARQQRPGNDSLQVVTGGHVAFPSVVSSYARPPLGVASALSTDRWGRYRSQQLCLGEWKTTAR